MSRITAAIGDIAKLDELVMGQSLIHRLHPLVKLLVTVFYIFTVTSFPIENLSGLIPMVFIPVILYTISGIPISLALYKLRWIVLFVGMVGIWNPFLDRKIVLQIGAISVSSGMISFFSLLLKGVFTLLASFLLISTTGIEKICCALRKMHIPEMFTTLILITYRYIDLLLTEAESMQQAYIMRAPGQKGLHFSVWGSFMGQLLIRSFHRAEELYNHMLLRGYDGNFSYERNFKVKPVDYFFLGIMVCMILVFRFVPVSELLGSLFVT